MWEDTVSDPITDMMAGIEAERKWGRRATLPVVMTEGALKWLQAHVGTDNRRSTVTVAEYKEIELRESEAKGSVWSMRKADLVFQANAHADIRKLLGEVQRLRTYIDQNVSPGTVEENPR